MRSMRVVVPRDEDGGAGDLEVVLRPRPEPQAGEVLIEVAAAGVNRADLLQRAGRYPLPEGASEILGLEVSGTVAAVGPGVESWRVGDRVVALTEGGGYAEAVTVPAGQVLPWPADLDSARAAALPEALFTVWSMLFMRAGARPGERLLVEGASSGVGITAVSLARACGLTVVGTVGAEAKVAPVLEAGAEVVLVRDATDHAESLKQAAGPAGFDLVLDIVGGDAVAAHQRLLARGGRHVSIAFLTGRTATLDLARLLGRDQTFLGGTLRPRSAEEKARIARELLDQVWPLLQSGRLRPVLHAAMPLERAGEAHRVLEGREHVGKVVLQVGDLS